MPAPDPYYEGHGVRLFLGRCEDVLPHLSGVQLTVTSPPYNQLHGANLRQGKNGPGISAGSIGSHGYDDDLPEPEYQAALVHVADLVAKASTPTAALFYNHKVRYRQRRPLHPLDLVRRFERWQLRQEVIWDTRGSAAKGGGMFVPGDERVFWLVRDLDDMVATRRAATWTTVWPMPRATVGRGDHPVPFPTALPERAVLAASRPGDLVLDPYAGSGTTLRVAASLRRRAVGIEAFEPYAEAAAELLEAM